MNRAAVYAQRYQALRGTTRYTAPVGFVNSLSVDNLLHQYLISGGADSSIRIYNLDSDSSSPEVLIEAKSAHKFGVSKVEWWLHDNGMFVSGSFDNTVNLWDTDSLESVYTFDVENKVYNFDINQTGIIATALDYPYIRLLDTRSGSQSHVLKGHAGKVLSVKWHPFNQYLLASAGSDGTVRLWDIRQANSQVECMDMNRTSPNKQLEPLEFRKSHRSAVNGLCWVPEGDRLVSLGNDNKVRVWNLTIEGGINEGMNFGPLIQNRYLQNTDPIISPSKHCTQPFLFVNVDSGAVMMFELGSGKVAKRLVPPAAANSSRQACIVVRGNQKVEYYTGDGAGAVTRWSAPEPTSGKDSIDAIRINNLAKPAPKGRATLGDFI